MSKDYDTIGFPSEREDLLFSTGSWLDEFELVECLGRGNMGEVWKARDHAGNRDVALKFVPRDLQRFDDEISCVRETFEKIHALQDRHICPVYAMRQHPQYGVYLVMKFIDGITLSKYRRRFEKFSSAQVVEVLTPVAEALDSAHEQGVIHRDIKPTNILIQTNPSDKEAIVDVQLVDFGLAAEIRKSMTRASQVEVGNSGTRPYMAPEQWRGQQQDGATDQYALAVVAYELLTGHLPFDVEDTTILRECVLRETPQKIDGITNTVNDALQRGLAKERKNRFANCRELIKALAGLSPVQAVSPQENTESQPRPVQQISREKIHFLQQHKGILIFLLVVCVVVFFASQPSNFIETPTGIIAIGIVIIVVNVLFAIVFLRGLRQGNVQNAGDLNANPSGKPESEIADAQQPQKKSFFSISAFIVMVLGVATGQFLVRGLFHNDQHSLMLIPFCLILLAIVMGYQRYKKRAMEAQNTVKSANLGHDAKAFVHAVAELQTHKLSWKNLVLAILCMMICVGISTAGFAAIGAGLGILLGMPAVLTPLGAGLGIIVGAAVGLAIASRIKFR